jgi:hypothetical protein
MSGMEIVFTGSGTAELRPYEDPPLGALEIRGRTLATLISPGTEIGWLNGGDFPVRPGYASGASVWARIAPRSSSRCVIHCRRRRDFPTLRL